MIKLSNLRQYFSHIELRNIINDLANYHRIQGSHDLVKAAKYLSDLLKDRTKFNVELIKLSYWKLPRYLDPLPGWDIIDGKAYIVSPRKSLIADFVKYPTSIAAFSPPGEFEGEVVYVGNGIDYEDPIDGVALTYGTSLDVYAKLVKLGAKGVIFFKRNTYSRGIPYINLLPSIKELNLMKVAAISIDRLSARRILKLIRKGFKVIVKGYVKARYYENPTLPIVEITLGDQSPEYHILAHFCHPRGMVNDNLSGTASLAEAVIALWRYLKNSGSTLGLKFGVKVLFVPEYFGSYTYLNLREEGVLASVNLDMIGEKQVITGSTLNIVRPPIPLLSPLEAQLYINLKRILSKFNIKFNIVNYDVGSDHDSYIAMGIPSIMINQWPDIYYHTHLDTIDKFDCDVAEIISLTSLITLLSIAKSGVPEYVVRNYLMFIKGLDLINSKNLNVLKAREYVYDKYVEPNLKIKTSKLNINNLRHNHEDILIEGEGGLMTLRYIRSHIGIDEYLNFKKQFHDLKLIRKILSIMSMILKMRKRIPLKEFNIIVNSEVNRSIDKEYLLNVLNILRDIGYINF